MSVKKIFIRFLGYLLTPVYLVLFVLLLIVFHPVQVICWNFWGYRAHKRSVEILNLLIIRFMIILGARVSFKGFEKLPHGRPIILISNHQSMFDIPPITWGFRNYHPKFISKKELGRGLPSISYNLKVGGSILIDRSKGQQALQEIEKLGRYIEANNFTACIFPEGTRTKDGKMKSFKPGGIQALIKASPSAVVVPFVIDGNYELLKKGIYPMQFGIRLNYIVLDPIEPSTVDSGDVSKMAETAIRDALESRHAKL